MANPKPVTNLSDPRWLRAVSHPIRIRLLAMLEEEPASPVILAAKLEQPLGTVAYHVRTLYDLGLLKLVSTRQRRGATEHYYKTVGHPSLSDEAWEELDAVSKQRLLTAMLTRAHEYATRSAAAGGFDRTDAVFTTSTLKLDEQGWTALASEAKKLQAKSQEIERAAAARIEKNPDSEICVGLTIHAFEGLPFSSQGAASGSGKTASNGNGSEAAGNGSKATTSAAGKSTRGSRRPAAKA